LSTSNASGTVKKLLFDKGHGAAAAAPDALPRASEGQDHTRLLQIVEAIADFVAIVDSSGRVTYINPAGRALMGIGEAEPVSQMRLPDFHPPGVEKDLEYVALPAAVRDGVWIGESVLLTRSGREVAVSEMLIVRKIPDGRLDSVTVVMRDIRKRKRGEAALRQSEARFWTVVETMNEGLVFIDRQGVVGFVNERFSAMIGRAPSELIGRAFADFVDPAHRHLLTGRFDASADGSLVRETKLLRADGRTAPIRVSLRRMADAGAAGSCAIVTDIARTAEVRLATSPLGQDQRSLSREIVAVQEAERKRIATDLHDGLGQSLSAVRFGLEQAFLKLSANEIEDATDIVGSLMSKVKDAIDDVRQVAMNLRPSTLDDLGILATLSWFLREFEATYGTITVDKAFGISEKDVPNSLKVTLFRVVQEAMNNVAKHSHATRVWICIKKTDDELQMTIEDNGVGFDPVELASRNVPGMGLGRAGLRDRVELSGGALSINAAPGNGVCLRMSWPRASADALEDGRLREGGVQGL
jgi:PAS domain S-box-containing protein